MNVLCFALENATEETPPSIKQDAGLAIQYIL